MKTETEQKRVTISFYTVCFGESGDCNDYTEDYGWENEDGIDCQPDEYDAEDGITAVEKAVEAITGNDCVYPSSSAFHPGVWYTSADGVTDYATGENTQYSYHLEGFSEEEQRTVFEKINRR